MMNRRYLKVELAVFLMIALIAFGGFMSLQSSSDDLTGAAALSSSDVVRLVRCLSGRDAYESMQDTNKCEYPGQWYIGPLGYIFKNQQPGTHLLKRCAAWGWEAMTSSNPNCEGQKFAKDLGYVYTKQQPGTVPLYRCFRGRDHLLSLLGNCEGSGRNEGIVGYILQKPPSPSQPKILPGASGICGWRYWSDLKVWSANFCK